MHADSGIRLPELRVDGGASSNNLLMQIQADLLGAPVVRSSVQETTALGAAFLAGLATGVIKNRSEVTTMWKADRRFDPSMSRDRAESSRAQWRRAVERAKGWEQ